MTQNLRLDKLIRVKKKTHDKANFVINELGHLDRREQQKSKLQVTSDPFFPN